jgi:hypothetical protein
MSDSRERDDQRLADEPNEAGFAGGATTPEVEREDRGEHGRLDRGTEEAERIAVPDSDLTTAISSAISRGTERGGNDEEESAEER